MGEGATHADECTVGNIMAGNEDRRPAAACPEGHDGAMGVMEAPKHRGEAGD
jgi:hypothetical protein